MNIWIYDNIYDGMVIHNESHASENYGNKVVKYAPTSPTYPLTVFDEIKNVVVKNYRTKYDKLTSNGYRLDVYAKTKGNVTKQEIARKIAKQMDDYLTDRVGLIQVSFNVMPLENDDSIYHITIMYENTFHINRAKFI